MKPRGAYPAVQEAFDFIEDKINTGVWRQGECLPSVLRLADMVGVSKPTIIKAVALLRDKNLVSSSRRRRTRAGGGGTLETKLVEKLAQWQEKRALFEKDVLSGIFGYRGNLPPLKELQTRYGVCYTTMKKMTRAMTADGILSPKGKGYSLPEIPARLFRHRVVFITMKGHFSQSSALNQEHNRIVNMFENECKRAGLHFEMMELDFYDSTENIHVASKLTATDPGMGFVLDVWWYDQVRRSYIDMLTNLLSFKRPVAVLDEVGDFELPVQFVSNPLVQVYTLEGKRAGERVSRYLLGLGHKSVVYVSSLHQARWSRDRFAGAAAQFSRVGLSGRVHLVADTFDMPLEKTLDASGLEDNDIRSLISVGRTPSQARDLESEWLRIKSDRGSRPVVDPRVDAELRKGFAAMATLIHQGLARDILEIVCNATLSAMGSRVYEMSLRPLFEKALEFRDATAWICANDAAAICALSFVRERNIAVPQELSVIGFDNTPVAALEQRLTTFDFNAAGFISRMLSFIIRPPRPRGPYRHSTIEIEGIILERETAGKAREERVE